MDDCINLTSHGTWTLDIALESFSISLTEDALSCI